LVNVIVYPSLYARQRHDVRATPLLIVEGRLQTIGTNINIVAERLVPLEDAHLAYPVRPPRSGDAREDPWVTEERVNSRVIQLDRRQKADGPRTKANIIGISPAAHSYR